MAREIEIAIVAVLLVLAAAGGWMLNGWRLGAELELRRAQAKVFESDVKACNAGVELARKAGEDGRALGRRLLAEAERLNAGNVATIASLEQLLERSEKPGASCEDAWREIEALHRKTWAPQ
jgi:hypothetical protein